MTEEMDIIRRKSELTFSLLKEGSIETVNDRAALYAASRIMFDDIERMMKTVDVARYENFDRDYVISQLRHFRSYAFYYLGLSDYTDIEMGDFTQVENFAYKFMKFIPEVK